MLHMEQGVRKMEMISLQLLQQYKQNRPPKVKNLVPETTVRLFYDFLDATVCKQQ
jgi:hypothetical protein